MNNAARTKLVFKSLILFCLFAAVIYLGRLSRENQALLAEVEQLEAELGRMEITDSRRIHLVEVKNPDVPPELGKQLDFICQFRCYIPPGYDANEFSGSGFVTEKGIYHSGSYGSAWRSSQKEPVQEIMTVSISKEDDYWRIFYSFGGTSGSQSWRPSRPDLTPDQLVVQKLVNNETGARSFAADTILTLLKIYDPNTAVEKEIDGKIQTVYQGCIILLSPKNRDPDFQMLINGITPPQFDPNTLAVGMSND
jgi:hypothetical protein